MAERNPQKPYPWIKRPEQKPLTGEVFVMRTPPVEWGNAFETIRRRRAWGKLQEALTRSGAEVRVIHQPAEDKQLKFRSGRDPLFARDSAVFVPEESLYFSGHSRQLNAERSALQRMLLNGDWQELEGKIEGGNALWDHAHAQLFVGIPHMVSQTEKHWKEPPKMPVEGGAQTLARYYGELQQYLRYKGQTMGNAEKLSAAIEQLVAKGVRVVPLFMPKARLNDFYHLDGVLGLLPTGQAIVCPKQLGRVANELLRKHLGRENILEISEHEARQGTTNFVTVGARVITPHASPKTRQWFEKLGYEVIDPPAMGLREGDWMFDDMAAVRCATLKVSEDIGFPPQAMSCHRAKAPGVWRQALEKNQKTDANPIDAMIERIHQTGLFVIERDTKQNCLKIYKANRHVDQEHRHPKGAIPTWNVAVEVPMRHYLPSISLENPKEALRKLEILRQRAEIQRGGGQPDF